VPRLPELIVSEVLFTKLLCPACLNHTLLTELSHRQFANHLKPLKLAQIAKALS
jgi:hypothetical protein